MKITHAFLATLERAAKKKDPRTFVWALGLVELVRVLLPPPSPWGKKHRDIPAVVPGPDGEESGELPQRAPGPTAQSQHVPDSGSGCGGTGVGDT